MNKELFSLDINSLLASARETSNFDSLILKFQKIQRERVPFYLNQCEFEEILHWKLRSQFERQKGNRALNTESIVKTITEAAFTITHELEEKEIELKLKLLCSLYGVRIPVASAVLTLCCPQKYSVIDFRNWRQIFPGDLRRTNYTINEYLLYLGKVRELSEYYNVTPQQMDVALWQFDRETNAK